jgi:Zn-dependent metalloprotease
VLLRFSQRPEALDRAVHTAGGTNAQPGLLLRSEGDPATGNLDADKAYDYMGSAYDYYFDRHGRDSFDGSGGLLTATVDFCPDAADCPYANAFWDGVQLVFGAGMSRADDVVAHELTHGVVERTANLFYYMQSGALNEGFADIFGESVDLENGMGNDSGGVRWVFGEDLPIGPVRNMMNPNAFGTPAR